MDLQINEINRPKWLKIALGVLSAWTLFIVTITILLISVWIIQIEILNIKIYGTPALIILIGELMTSAFFSYRLTKWQNRYFENKSLTTNYVFLAIMLLLSILLLAVSFAYMI